MDTDPRAALLAELLVERFGPGRDRPVTSQEVIRARQRALTAALADAPPSRRRPRLRAVA